MQLHAACAYLAIARHGRSRVANRVSALRAVVTRTTYVLSVRKTYQTSLLVDTTKLTKKLAERLRAYRLYAQHAVSAYIA